MLVVVTLVAGRLDLLEQIDLIGALKEDAIAPNALIVTRDRVNLDRCLRIMGNYVNFADREG